MKKLLSETTDEFGLPGEDELDEKASKELKSFNLELLSLIKKAMGTIPGARILKSNYTANGIHAEILFKEPTGSVRHYHMTLTKDYGVTPDLPEDK